MLSTFQSPSVNGEARCSHQTLSQGRALQLHMHNPQKSVSLGNCSADLWCINPVYPQSLTQESLQMFIHEADTSFSHFWAIKTRPGRMVGEWPHKTTKTNRSSTEALQSCLRTALHTHRKVWTRSPEVQLTAGGWRPQLNSPWPFILQMEQKQTSLYTTHSSDAHSSSFHHVSCMNPGRIWGWTLLTKWVERLYSSVHY